MRCNIFFIMFLFSIIELYAQEECINIHLEDTSFFEQKTSLELIKLKHEILYEDGDKNALKYYIKYFNVTSGIEFFLKDSLDDGCYCLYNLTKKQFKKTKDKEKYLVTSGCFKNKMRQGKFIHTNGLDKFALGSIYKEISFVNDTVHGSVIEMHYGYLDILEEYNMGIKDGFSFWKHRGSIVIKLYKQGELLEESNIDINP